MTDLLRAEWRKLAHHPRLVLFTLGVLPLGVGILAALQAAMLTVSAEARATAPAQDWITEASSMWALLNSDFSILGRLLPLAFMAVAFTTEYQSGTWKTILPGHPRAVVLLAKYLVITAMAWVAFLVLAGVAVAGAGVVAAVSGQAYGPSVAGQGWAAFGETFGRESLFGLYTLLFLSWVAALAASYAHTPLVVIVVGLIVSGLENVSLPLLLLLSRWLRQPAVIEWYQVTPAYNLLNLRSWLVADAAISLPPPFTLAAAPSAWFSVVVLAVWLAALAGLTLWVFQRQDITA